MGNTVPSLMENFQMIGIYKITNTVNGKTYIGQSRNLKQRKIDHFKPSTRKSHDWELYQDMDEFGVDKFKFSVLEETSLDLLDEREEYYLRSFEGELYNATLKAIPAQDDRMRVIAGKNIAKFNAEHWKNDEYRKYKSKFSSELQKRRLKDPDYLAEKSKQLKRYTDTLKKRVGQYSKDGSLVAEFEGVREAERATGIPSQSISKVALGEKYRITAGGFVWKYL